jgi:hypothetical protein
MKSWLLFLSGLLPLVATQVADAGSGGGPGADPGSTGGASPAPDGSAAPDDGDGLDAGAGDDAGARGDDPNAVDGDDEPLENLLVGDEDDQDARPWQEQRAAMRAKNRKLARRLARESGLSRQLGGRDPQELLESERILNRIIQLRDTDPKKLLRTLGIDAPPPASSTSDLPSGVSRDLRGKRGTDEAESFDFGKLPFDPDQDETTRYFASMARTLDATVRELNALKGERQQERQQQTTAARARQERSWNVVASNASEKISDSEKRTLFMDNMVLARELVLAGHPRYRDKSPEFLANHYLKLLKVTPQEAKQVSAAIQRSASQVRSATTVAAQPRQHVGMGSPARPQGDVRKTRASIRERLDNLADED